MSDPFIAEIRIFAGNFAPRGWAFCDGGTVPISQNTALFSIIGTIYGGDGRTTAGLPDLRGRAPMHAGSGPGLTPRRAGQKTGAERVGLSSNQMPAHSHGLRAASDFTQADPSGTVAPGPAAMYSPVGNLVDMAPDALGNSGGSGSPHRNTQPYLTLNFVIAMTGMFPSRS